MADADILFWSCFFFFFFFFFFLWPPYVIGQAIIFLPCGFYLLSSSLFFPLALSQRPRIGCLPYFYTWCGPSANLECRSEMCCTQLAGYAGPKNRQKFTIGAPTLWGYIFATKTYRQWEKLLNSSISPTYPHNMVNFSPLTAEIRSGIWVSHLGRVTARHSSSGRLSVRQTVRH